MFIKEIFSIEADHLQEMLPSKFLQSKRKLCLFVKNCFKFCFMQSFYDEDSCYEKDPSIIPSFVIDSAAPTGQFHFCIWYFPILKYYKIE